MPFISSLAGLITSSVSEPMIEAPAVAPMAPAVAPMAPAVAPMAPAVAPMAPMAPAVNPSFKKMVDKTADMASDSMIDALGSTVFDVASGVVHGVALYKHYKAKQHINAIQKQMTDPSSLGKFMSEFENFKSGNNFAGVGALIGTVNSVWGALRTAKTNSEIKDMTLANH